MVPVIPQRALRVKPMEGAIFGEYDLKCGTDLAPLLPPRELRKKSEGTQNLEQGLPQVKKMINYHKGTPVKSATTLPTPPPVAYCALVF